MCVIESNNYLGTTMLSGTWVPRSRVPDCMAILFGTQWVPGPRSRVPDCWVPESIVVIWDRVSWVPDPGSLIVTAIHSGTQTRTIKRGYVMLVSVPDCIASVRSLTWVPYNYGPAIYGCILLQQIFLQGPRTNSCTWGCNYTLWVPWLYCNVLDS